jgi:DHA1 family inner membrane transport protein
VTEAAAMSPSMTPVAQTLIGFGIAAGTLAGGVLADRYRFRAMVLCLVAGMAAMALMYVLAALPPGLLAAFFVVPFLLNAGVPSITVQMMRMAPDAPTMMGALNMAAFNVGNAIGAVAGAVTVDAGLGVRSPILAGLALTGAALGFFAAAFPYVDRSSGTVGRESAPLPKAAA